MEIEIKPTKDKFLLANFTNGKLKKETAKRVKFGCFEQNVKFSETNKRKMLIAETNGLRYVGHNFGMMSPASRGLSKYMVGVVNKESGKMRIFDADVFNMRPEFLDNTDSEEKNEMSFVQKHDELTAAFGSTKKKRAMASRKRNTVKEESLQQVVGSAVDQALETPGADALLTPAKNQKTASEIPPYNMDATKPDEVYKLNSIISDVELEELTAPAKLFVDTNKDIISQWESEEKYPSYILNHLRIMPIQEEARLHRSKCLTYLHYLITMYHLGYSDIRKKEPFPPEIPIPPLIKKRMLQKYTIQVEGSRQGQRVMPARMKDKLVSYMLVLCLIIDEFNMQYADLVKDLKLNQRRMETFIRALGCKVIKKKIKLPSGSRQDIALVSIPIPLTFPDATVRQKERRN